MLNKPVKLPDYFISLQNFAKAGHTGFNSR